MTQTAFWLIKQLWKHHSLMFWSVTAKIKYAFPFTGLHEVQVSAALIQFLLPLYMHRPSLQTCQSRLLFPVYKYPREMNASLVKILEIGGVDGHKKKFKSFIPSRVQTCCSLYILDLKKKNVFTMGKVQHENKLLSEVVQSLSLQIFETWLDQALSTEVCAHGSPPSEQEVGLGTTRGPFQAQFSSDPVP